MCGRRDDLQVEVSSVRKDLLAGQENITLLETEVRCKCACNTACLLNGCRKLSVISLLHLL